MVEPLRVVGARGPHGQHSHARRWDLLPFIPHSPGDALCYGCSEGSPGRV